jgi:hypothetical protein
VCYSKGCTNGYNPLFIFRVAVYIQINSQRPIPLLEKIMIIKQLIPWAHYVLTLQTQNDMHDPRTRNLRMDECSVFSWIRSTPISTRSIGWGKMSGVAALRAYSMGHGTQTHAYSFATFTMHLSCIILLGRRDDSHAPSLAKNMLSISTLFIQLP